MCSKKLQEQLSADAELPAAVEVPTAVDPSEVETERSGHVVRCVEDVRPREVRCLGCMLFNVGKVARFFLGVGGYITLYNLPFKV